MVTYTFVPGAVAANTPTALPGDAPRFRLLTSVVVQTEAAGGTASTTSPVQAQVAQTVPPGGLGANQFALLYGQRPQQWQFGSATTAGTVLTLIGYAQGELPVVS